MDGPAHEAIERARVHVVVTAHLGHSAAFGLSLGFRVVPHHLKHRAALNLSSGFRVLGYSHSPSQHIVMSKLSHQSLQIAQRGSRAPRDP